jgi:hypothetical protein
MRVIFEKGRSPADGAGGDFLRGRNEWCLECRLEERGLNAPGGELTVVSPLRLSGGALVVALARRGAKP